MDTKTCNQKVFEISVEMLECRGYEIIDSEENMILAERDSERVLLTINDEPKLNINTIKDIINLLAENDIKHGVIVYHDTITSTAKKIIDNLQDYELELFPKKDLMYNPTKSRLVPTHIRLPKEERDDMYKKYGLKLKKILTKDVISRFYNFKVNDIIRIIQKDGTISYRICR